MSKIYFFLLLAWVLPLGSWAQTSTTLQGTVQTESGQLLPGATVFLKGTYVGSSTNENGKFILQLKQANFPEVLVVSFVGFETEEVRVDQPTENLEIILQPSDLLTTVVVAASRAEENIGQAPVTINKLNQRQLEQITTPDLNAGLGRLKNVDIISASLLTTSFSTRGFNSGLSARVIQLSDYMDTQVPSLSSPFGNQLGTPVLDVASMELVQGPASALYGANAFNGVLLTISRDPFLDQGLSVRLRGGSRSLLDGQLRYAQQIGKRVAFKIAAGAIIADDFYANDLSPASPLITPRNNSADSNLGYDAVNRYGDVPSTYKTGLLAGKTVYMPGYLESDLISDNRKAHNYKFMPTLAVLLSNTVKATVDYKYTNTTTTFQNSGRYRFVNSGVNQGRLQVQGSNWVVRAFATQDFGGARDPKTDGTYSLGFLGDYLQNQTSFIDPTTGLPVSYSKHYFDTYQKTYEQAYNSNGNNADAAALTARTEANATAPQLQPGTPLFEQARQSIIHTPTPQGARIASRSLMSEASGQYNFKNPFANIIVGAAYRHYLLGSDGSLFEDVKDGDRIGNYEYGAYGEARKAVLNDRLKLSAAARIDRFKNFGTAFSPRAAVVYSADVDKHHNFRASFSRAFRAPVQTDQYIKLDISKVILLGNVRGGFQGYSLTGQELSVEGLKLEEVTGYEVGYRAELSKRLYVDVNYYYNTYNNFIGGQTFIGNTDGSRPTPAQFAVAAGSEFSNPALPTRVILAATNVDQRLQSQGAGIELSYTVSPALTLLGNYSFANLITKDLKEGTRSFFNTPRHKFNLGFDGQALNRTLSYNLNYRWVESFLFEDSFAISTLPVSQTVDAQVGYTLKNLHTTLQVGGTNLFNSTNVQMAGAPQIGRIGYFGLLFDIK